MHSGCELGSRPRLAMGWVLTPFGNRIRPRAASGGLGKKRGVFSRRETQKHADWSSALCSSSPPRNQIQMAPVPGACLVTQIRLRARPSEQDACHRDLLHPSASSPSHPLSSTASGGCAGDVVAGCGVTRVHVPPRLQLCSHPVRAGRPAPGWVTQHSPGGRRAAQLCICNSCPWERAESLRAAQLAAVSTSGCPTGAELLSWLLTARQGCRGLVSPRSSAKKAR